MKDKEKELLITLACFTTIIVCCFMLNYIVKSL